MLSHLVWAANRADIRRLQQLEADDAALAAKVERQQRQLHEGFVERDRTIRELNELLSTRASGRSERPSDHGRCTDDDRFETAVHDLTKRLVQETAAPAVRRAMEECLNSRGSQSTIRPSRSYGGR